VRPRAITAVVGAALVLLLLAGAVQAATETPRVERCDDTTLQELSELMRDRTVALDQRTQNLAARERDLVGAEAELRARVAELEATRAAVEVLVERADAIRSGRVAALVKSVEAMRPKLAGKVLASTEHDVAVEVLTALSPSRTGKILAEMPPETAARFVEALARNSLARR
jgi:flagellar motility protein MotE (MotC chaperone)